MKPAPLWILLAWVFCHGTVGWAAPFVGALLLSDHGQRREFEIARDALQVTTGGHGSILLFDPQPSGDAVSRKAAALRLATGAEVRLVLYPTDQPRTEYSCRILAGTVLIRLEDGAELPRVLQEARRLLTEREPAVRGSGKIRARRIPLRGWAMFEAPTSESAFPLCEALRSVPGVKSAEVQLAALHTKKLVPSDTLFPLQWHLSNTGQNGGTPGCDLALTNVWNVWRGLGVTVGVVDDGIHPAHPDLAPNLDVTLGTNLNSNPYAPASDWHGSRVAGLIAAAGNNGFGVAGVAFNATLVDIRLLGAAATDEQDALSVLYESGRIHIKNNSWGATDGSGVLEGPGPLMSGALAEACSSGRNGLGTVMVFAGGNGREYGENVNYDGFANSLYVIAVGAVTDQGEQATYSEPGACLTVSAPSGSAAKLCSGGRQSLTTTDLPGSLGVNYSGAFCELEDRDYTQNFSGTSGATALASGIAALILEANPALSWRDVKEILMRSARKVVPGDPDWHTNSAGVAHNHRFGAGLINAERAIQLTTNWLPLAPLSSISRSDAGLNLPVPDNQAGGLTRTMTFTNAGFRVESAALRLTLPHEYFGDLAVTLISPDGTTSRLAERHTSSGQGYNAWTFTSVRHWGESARGTWTVKVADLSPTRTGTLQSLELTLLGSTPRPALSLARNGNVWSARLRAPSPGWTYALEASTDLAQWQEIQRLQIDETGQALAEEAAGGEAVRFYRARLLE